MTVITALFIDAYRQLNAKKLFWVTLAISAVVVLVYASIGFDENGMTMFFGLTHVENEFITEGSPIAKLLYRSIFSSFIVSLWLAWIATILALISTTTIFPDFLAEGSVDIVLSKPIRRASLFIIKYLASLLFVLLQVGLFCIGVFICMGWRLGDWNWMIFAAVPLVTVFYSYLYSVNVLVGVITRSAMTALLVTMLFWFSLFGVNVSEGILNQITTQFEVSAEDSTARIAAIETQIDLARQADEDAESERAAVSNLQQRLESQREEQAKTDELLGKLDAWHERVRLMQAALPKTDQTIALLDRWLKEDTDVNLMDVLTGNLAMDDQGEFVPEESNRDREVALRMQAEFEARSSWWVIGTSLAFEAVVLAIACLIFVRRDY